MGALLSEPVTAMVVERSASKCWVASTVTMQGWRRTHEDAHILRGVADGLEESGVFAVLDGHGGDVAAHSVSSMLEERLVALAKRGTLDPTSAAEELQDAFIQSDARLREQLDPNDKSGTTVVAAIITRPRPAEYCVQLAHCGDSRAVLCSGGGLTCSVDHKPQREDEVKRIEAAGGTVVCGPVGGGPMRVDGALAVSRALGDFQYKPAGMAPCLCKVTAVPEVQTITGCAPGDWLLLACDGIFDVFGNDEVHDFVSTKLRETAPEPADGGAILVELLRLCLSRGSKDNCTACLVQLRANGTPAPTSRELLQGSWPSACPEVQAKYAEFFAAHGFESEARQMRPPVGSPPAAQMPPRSPQKEEPVRKPEQQAGSGHSATSSNGTPLHRQLAALAGALQAMCSTRGMPPWRSRRGRSNEASAVSAATGTVGSNA